MMDWAKVLWSLCDQREPCLLVTVAAVTGSAPREAGAKMIVTQRNTFGTIGGGQLEFQATARARSFLSEETARVSCLEDLLLGPELGQCCGGRAQLLFERIGKDDHGWLEQLLGRRDATALLVTEVGRSGKQVFRDVEEAKAVLSLTFPDDPEGAEGARLLNLEGAGAVVLETVADRRTPLYLFGAGHVGRAVATALAPLPFKVTWIDDRPDSFPVQLPEGITVEVVDPPFFAVDRAPSGAFYLVMTHSHPLDQAVCEAVLRRGDAAYLGLIGSGTKRARFAHRLTAKGIPVEAIDNLHCPIGLPGIAGKEPAIIAAAVAADLLLRRSEAQARRADSRGTDDENA